MSKIRILIVEDEIDTVELLKNYLTKNLSCDVITVDNGISAINEMSNNQYDIVILDIKMPGLSGLDVIKKVKDKITDSNILVVTAWDSAQVAQEVITEGAVDYVVKPVMPDVLLMKITDILGKQKVSG